MQDWTSQYAASNSTQFCASQHVCSAAIEDVDPLRARWIERKLNTRAGTNQPLASSARPTRLPLCMNGPLPPKHHFSGQFALQQSSSNANLLRKEQALHVVFYDDTANPSLGAMADVARLGNSSRVGFIALLAVLGKRELAWSQQTGISIIRIDVPSLPPLARCLYSGLSRTVAKSQRWSTGVLLRVMMFAFLPKHVRIAIGVDSDIVPLRPFDHLLDTHVQAMRRQGAFVGLVAEQSRFYVQSKEMPRGLPGFNGGVQLHDVVAMREVGTYAATLDAFQAGLLFPKVGSCPEQNVFNGVSSLFPHFVYNMGCDWNRQMGSWTMKHFTARPSRPRTREDLELDAEVHSCPAGCAVLHANIFKCAAPTMRNANGSCIMWAALLDRLERGENTSCPDTKTYRKLASKYRLDSKGKWQRLSVVEQGYALAQGFRRWFGACCVYNGVGARVGDGGSR